MPSLTMKALSEQIERQPTDNFGKFYLYTSLLNVMAVRKKSFLQTLPTYTGLTGSQLQYGEITPQFSAEVDRYKLQYIPQKSDPITAVLKILQIFLRQGQMSDLFFVINKMNEHLKRPNMATQQYNLSLYKNVAFDRRKQGVIELLECAQNIVNLAQKGTDNIMYGFLTFLGGLITLHVIGAVAGMVLSTLILAMTGYSSYWFFQNSINAFQHLNAEVRRCNTITKDMINHQTGNIYTPNNLNFIIKSVLAPIDYMGVSIQEQLAFTDATARISQENRQRLDILFDLVDKSSELGAIMRIELK